MEAWLICESLLLENRNETPINLEGSDITPLFKENRSDIADTWTYFPDILRPILIPITKNMFCDLSTHVM